MDGQGAKQPYNNAANSGQGQNTMARANTGARPTGQGKAPTVRDLLYGVLTNASWIPSAYKEQAHEDEPVEWFRMLFLCALDEVPIEYVEKARQSGVPAESLRILRNECLEQRYVSRQNKTFDTQLDVQTKRIDALEKNWGKVGEILLKFESMMPNKELFSADEKKTIFNTSANQPDIKSEENEVFANDIPVISAKIGGRVISFVPASPGEENTLQNIKPEVSRERRSFFRKRVSNEKEKPEPKASNQKNGTQDIADWVSGLIKKDGYSIEQANWITDCLKVGDTTEELSKFIRPNLPVEMMAKLRGYYFQNRPPVPYNATENSKTN